MNPDIIISQESKDTVAREAFNMLPNGLNNLSKMFGLDTLGERIMNTPGVPEAILVVSISGVIVGLLMLIAAFMIYRRHGHDSI